VEPDAEIHAAFGGELRVVVLQSTLNLHCAIHGIESAHKLGQHIVTYEVHHAPIMSTNERGYLRSVCSERPDGRYLVLRHEPTVADHISAQNRSESVFEVISTHLQRSAFEEDFACNAGAVNSKKFLL
jgi:hypothetical protein